MGEVGARVLFFALVRGRDSWKKQARGGSRVIQSESAVVRDVLVLGGRAGYPPYDIRRKDVVVL